MKDSGRKDAKILVVDDDREVADMVKDFLSDLGYSVTKAYGGREALARFQEGDFQLVITDLKMPEIDGVELLETIKKIDNKVAFIVVTGYGTIESAVKAIKAGAYDFIEKPLRMEQLRIIVERALERYSLARQLGIFKGLTLALLVSIPLWLVLGIVLVLLWR